VGTAEKVREAIAAELGARGVDVGFDVCSNPEFLKEGSAIADFTRAARIIVGTDSALVRDVMQRCYAPYNRNHNKMMFMDIRSAELTKYAANAMLATRISFMNEIARLAEHLGADIEQVRLGVGSDPRIGLDFLYAGAGYGGSCFPKDVRALAHTALSVGHEPTLLNAVEAVNTAQKNWLFDKVREGLGGSVEGKTVAIWGLSFKPNTDDMREAPSQVVIQSLWAHGATVKAFDPQARHEAERIWGQRDDLALVTSADAALSDADALVICTEWSTFRGVDLAAVKSRMRGDLIVDGRNLYDPTTVSQAGLRYISVGRPSA
jgi:UDPglucose 6-dehydrogenase